MTQFSVPANGLRIKGRRMDIPYFQVIVVQEEALLWCLCLRPYDQCPLKGGGQMTAKVF